MQKLLLNNAQCAGLEEQQPGWAGAGLMRAGSTGAGRQGSQGSWAH